MNKVFALLSILIVAVCIGCATDSRIDQVVTVSRIDVCVAENFGILPTTGEVKSVLDPFLHSRRYMLSSESPSEELRMSGAYLKNQPVVDGETINEVWTIGAYREVRLITKTDRFVIFIMSINNRDAATVRATQEFLKAKFPSLKMTVKTEQILDN